VLLWQNAISDILASIKNTLIGLGPGMFSATTREFALYGKEAIHNYYLQFAHSYGLLGLVALAGYLLHIFSRYGVLRSGPAAAFWVFNAHAVFDVGWVAGTGLMASLMIALLLIQGSSPHVTGEKTVDSADDLSMESGQS